MSGGGTPGPISNPAVKSTSPDDTALSRRGKVRRRQAPCSYWSGSSQDGPDPFLCDKSAVPATITAPMTLPAGFVQRMTALLGAEADAFLATLALPSLAGLRINPLKLTPDRLGELVPWPLTPIPWCSTGFVLTGDDQP